MGKADGFVASFLSKGEEVALRNLRSDDCGGMLDCMNSVVAKRAYIFRKEPKTMKEQEKDMQEWLSYIEKGETVCLVAELAGRMVGYASVSKDLPYLVDSAANLLRLVSGWDGIRKFLRRFRGIRRFLCRFSRTGGLAVVLVHADMQGRGIGENLTKAVIAQAQKVFDIRKVVLNTSVPNKNAIKLYEKLGFVKTNKRMPARLHHGEIEERIEMVKELRP
jgi:ribosomal protein S18 acetylase RimI-like enzyme